MYFKRRILLFKQKSEAKFASDSFFMKRLFLL